MKFDFTDKQKYILSNILRDTLKGIEKSQPSASLKKQLNKALSQLDYHSTRSNLKREVVQQLPSVLETVGILIDREIADCNNPEVETKLEEEQTLESKIEDFEGIKQTIVEIAEIINKRLSDEM